LGLGSLGALLVLDFRAKKLVGALFWPALAAMFFVLVSPLSEVHPRWDALVVCVVTLVVILREHPLFDFPRWWKPLSFTGNISYSLYLVHWPLFAFLNNVWIGPGDIEQPLELRIALLALSFVFAYALYRYV